MHFGVRPELLFNMDETGTRLVCQSNRTLASSQEGSSIYMKYRGNTKEQITTFVLVQQQRPGAPRGEGDVGPFVCVVKGATSCVIGNVLLEMTMHDEAIEDQLVVQFPEFLRARSSRKRMRAYVNTTPIPLELHAAMVANPKKTPYGGKLHPGKIPYVLFKNGSGITASTSGWCTSAVFWWWEKYGADCHEPRQS